MKISEISVKRPVFATMMILALMVVGAFSYYELPVELFPEVDFPFEEAAQFQDLENGERIPVVPEKLRDEYREHIEAHLDTLKRRMLQNEIDYCFVQTSQPLDHALFEYLSRRERMSRVR